MKHKILYFLLVVLMFLSGCGVTAEKQNDTEQNIQTQQVESQITEVIYETEEVSEEIEEDVTENIPEPTDEEMVLVKTYIPDIVIDLKYATEDNFTGQIIYESTDAYLRYGTVKKLMQAQELLKPMGYKIILWDGYRPVEAQYKLWEICPDSTYVANPNTGYSSHSRGNTVDISLVTLDGKPVEMPTGFDDFTTEADRDYSDVSQNAASHAQLLEDVMEQVGFRGYYGEWWHYTDTTDYPVAE